MTEPGNASEDSARNDANRINLGKPTDSNPSGATGTGPGWDTYSGVGNGPGWAAPTYPAPSGVDPSAALPNTAHQPDYTASGPVYGAPDPQYAAQPGIPQQAGYQQPGYAQPGYPQNGYAQPGYDPTAPFGRHPMTGEPYSDKQKLVAGLLQIFLGGFGAGRFYLNQPGLAVAQIAATWLTCGFGGIWPLIDGIMMLTGSVKDEHGRPLREN